MYPNHFETGANVPISCPYSETVLFSSKIRPKSQSFCLLFLHYAKYGKLPERPRIYYRVCARFRTPELLATHVDASISDCRRQGNDGKPFGEHLAGIVPLLDLLKPRIILPENELHSISRNTLRVRIYKTKLGCKPTRAGIDEMPTIVRIPLQLFLGQSGLMARDDVTNLMCSRSGTLCILWKIVLPYHQNKDSGCHISAEGSSGP